jgi:ATP-dependent exoDNAse (exonuclease V) beta subunit
MTMHAAKGLEFPIVFLVNLQAPGRGRGGGISIIERGPGGNPEVAFTSTDGTRLEDQRDAEELRRLLYVGVTRARDQLYLAAELDQRGQVRRSARSLANLLPASLLAAYAQAGATPDADRVTWQTTAGQFAFRVCRPAPFAVASRPLEEDLGDLDVAWLTPAQAGPVAATAGNGAGPDFLLSNQENRPGPQLLGTLVHRLFRLQLAGDLPIEALYRRATESLLPADRLDLNDVDARVREAVSLYSRLRERPEVAVLTSGSGSAGGGTQVLYEVPFSFAGSNDEGVTLRGVVDCLVVPAEGPPVILEFKTGQPRPEHRLQVERYAEAIGRILAVNHVETKILYA